MSLKSDSGASAATPYRPRGVLDAAATPAPCGALVAKVGEPETPVSGSKAPSKSTESNKAKARWRCIRCRVVLAGRALYCGKCIAALSDEERDLDALAGEPERPVSGSKAPSLSRRLAARQ